MEDPGAGASRTREENVETMTVKVELLDDAESQDDFFEESDWDDGLDVKSETESEIEIEPDQGDLIEDAETWEEDGALTKIPFVGKPGLRKYPNGDGPYDFFELLFDDSFFSSVVDGTNKFGETNLRETWKDLTVSEFKVFLGLLLHMGTIKCPRIENYWSKSDQFGFQCFSRHMSKQRFQNVLRSLRFSSGDETDRGLEKIGPVVDYFNKKMREVYYPRRELSVGSNRKAKHGARVYVARESSGTALRMKVSAGNGDDSNEKGQEIVLHLLEDFLNRGHSIFVDDSYGSFGLVSKLLGHKSYCTGILKSTRRGNNLEVTDKKLLKNEVISRFKDNVVVGKFKDKRDALFVSSEFKATLREYENKYKEKIVQPIALRQYTKFMSGVHRKDEMLSYYSCSRGTFEWFVKLWIHLVETLILNSFNLYKTYSLAIRKLSFYDYRLEILRNLIGKAQDGGSTTPETYDHLPEILPRNKNGKVNRKMCRKCYKEGKYCRSNYSCPACIGNPGLCLGECFKWYHQQINV